METQTGNNLIIDVHVSVDCVLIGFDGEAVSRFACAPDRKTNGWWI